MKQQEVIFSFVLSPKCLYQRCTSQQEVPQQLLHRFCLLWTNCSLPAHRTGRSLEPSHISTFYEDCFSSPVVKLETVVCLFSSDETSVTSSVQERTGFRLGILIQPYKGRTTPCCVFLQCLCEHKSLSYLGLGVAHEGGVHMKLCNKCICWT